MEVRKDLTVSSHCGRLQAARRQYASAVFVIVQDGEKEREIVMERERESRWDGARSPIKLLPPTQRVFSLAGRKERQSIFPWLTLRSVWFSVWKILSLMCILAPALCFFSSFFLHRTHLLSLLVSLWQATPSDRWQPLIFLTANPAGCSKSSESKGRRGLCVSLLCLFHQRPARGSQSASIKERKTGKKKKKQTSGRNLFLLRPHAALTSLWLLR